MLVHEPWWSLRHSGMVKMLLTRLGNLELYRQESVGRHAFSVTLLDGTSTFDSRILHQKGATCARGRVLKFIHVVNNDTIMHAVHTCTVAFSTQS